MKKLTAGLYNQSARTSDNSINTKMDLSQGDDRVGNPEMIGRRGKECEFVHKGAEARRPKKRALSRVNRSQMMGRSTPWKGIFSDTTHDDWRRSQDQSRGREENVIEMDARLILHFLRRKRQK
jgi:hypothetical protein